MRPYSEESCGVFDSQGKKICNFMMFSMCGQTPKGVHILIDLLTKELMD